MPTVTFPKLCGQSRSLSTASKKPHSTASAWENCCGTTICRRRTLFFPWERLSLDPSPILRSTLRVFGLLFMFTDVVHCTTTEIDCNWQQPRGEGIIVPFSVSFSISLHTECMKKGKIRMAQEQAYTRCPSRAGPDHLSYTGTASMPARRRVDPSDGHRFLGETQSSARGRWR